MKNRFGSDVPLQIGIQSPQTQVQIVASSGNLGLVDKTVHAGEYHAIGYDLQGMSQQQLEATKATLEASKAKLDAFQTSKDTAALQGLTKHDLTGVILQAGVQSYFAVNDTQDYIAAKQSKTIVANRHLAFGTFSTNLTPNQRYGLTLGAKLSGMMMDIDQLRRTAVNTDNDLNQIIAFNTAQGPRQSANEHLIPEALFDDPATTEKEAEAISAVKALQIAQQQGQKIFTITQANIAQALPQLSHRASVMEDVQNAVNAGKVVTISQSQISYKGWTGTGYVIVDPKTGAGAYLIGGGLDGGVMTSISNSINNDSYNLTMYCALLSLISMAGSFTALTISLPISALLTTAIILLSAGLAYATLMDMNSRCEGELFKSEPYFVLAFSILALILGLIGEFGAQVMGLIQGTLIGVIGSGRCP